MHLDINELYEEVCEIYDYNLVAILMHISYLVEKGKKSDLFFTRKELKEINRTFSLSKTKIKEDLEQSKNLERYRVYFLKIMDTILDEIKQFKKLASFDLDGIRGPIYLISLYSNEKGVMNKLKKRDIVKLEKQLVEIIFYSQQAITNIQKGEH